MYRTTNDDTGTKHNPEKQNNTKQYDLTEKFNMDSKGECDQLT